MEIKQCKISTTGLMTIFKVISTLTSKDFMNATKLVASSIVDTKGVSINGKDSMDMILESMDTESLTKISASIDILSSQIPFEAFCALLCKVSSRLNTKVNINKKTQDYINMMSPTSINFDVSCEDGALKIQMKNRR